MRVLLEHGARPPPGLRADGYDSDESDEHWRLDSDEEDFRYVPCGAWDAPSDADESESSDDSCSDSGEDKHEDF